MTSNFLVPSTLILSFSYYLFLYKITWYKKRALMGTIVVFITQHPDLTKWNVKPYHSFSVKDNQFYWNCNCFLFRNAVEISGHLVMKANSATVWISYVAFLASQLTILQHWQSPFSGSVSYKYDQITIMKESTERNVCSFHLQLLVLRGLSEFSKRLNLQTLIHLIIVQVFSTGSPSLWLLLDGFLWP